MRFPFDIARDPMLWHRHGEGSCVQANESGFALT